MIGLAGFVFLASEEKCKKGYEPIITRDKKRKCVKRGEVEKYEISRYINNMNDTGDNMENIKRVGYGSGPFGSYEFGGQPISLATCPTVAKYSGDTLTLQATPKDGTGPYYVVFKKGIGIINPSRLGNQPNPILNAPENTLITRIYTLDDVDIAGASGGTIDFSVYMEDSCPTGPMTCTDTCTITIGCVAPVCNFTVT